MSNNGYPVAQYARLAVDVGLNLQAGQDVLVVCDVEQRRSRAPWPRPRTTPARGSSTSTTGTPACGASWPTAPRTMPSAGPPYRIKQVSDLAERQGALVSISGPRIRRVAGVTASGSPLGAGRRARAFLEVVGEAKVNWTIRRWSRPRRGRGGCRRAGRPAPGGEVIITAVRRTSPNRMNRLAQPHGLAQGACRPHDGGTVRHDPPRRAGAPT